MGSDPGPETLPHHVLVVRVGSRRLALPATDLRRIVRDLQVFPLPGADPSFAGLAQLGGEPLPVMDLGVVAGDAERSVVPNRLAVVVALPGPSGEQPLGLAVDEAIALEAVTGDGGPLGGTRVRVGSEELELFDPRTLRRDG